MYGICNQCGNQEESKSAFCPKCQHAWNLFPAQPRNPEEWSKSHGPFERARRTFPPWILRGIYLGSFSLIGLVGVDIWAMIKDIHLTSYSNPFTYSLLILFDLFCFYLAFRTIRLSLKNYERLRLIIAASFGGSAFLFIHVVTRMIGHTFVVPAITYISIRLLLLGIVSISFLRPRVHRSMLRHGSSNS